MGEDMIDFVTYVQLKKAGRGGGGSSSSTVELNDLKTEVTLIKNSSEQNKTDIKELKDMKEEVDAVSEQVTSKVQGLENQLHEMNAANSDVKFTLAEEYAVLDKNITTKINFKNAIISKVTPVENVIIEAVASDKKGITTKDYYKQNDGVTRTVDFFIYNQSGKSLDRKKVNFIVPTMPASTSKIAIGFLKGGSALNIDRAYLKAVSEILSRPNKPDIYTGGRVHFPTTKGVIRYEEGPSVYSETLLSNLGVFGDTATYNSYIVKYEDASIQQVAIGTDVLIVSGTPEKMDGGFIIGEFDIENKRVKLLQRNDVKITKIEGISKIIIAGKTYSVTNFTPSNQNPFFNTLTEKWDFATYQKDMLLGLPVDKFDIFGIAVHPYPVSTVYKSEKEMSSIIKQILEYLKNLIDMMIKVNPKMEILLFGPIFPATNGGDYAYGTCTNIELASRVRAYDYAIQEMVKQYPEVVHYVELKSRINSDILMQGEMVSSENPEVKEWVTTNGYLLSQVGVTTLAEIFEAELISAISRAVKKKQ